MSRTLAASLIGCLALGCASTRVYSGRPPGALAAGYDAHWHSALLLGAIALSKPYDLATICKEGWSEVRVEPDPFTLITTVATLFVYTPSRVTVVCAAESGSGRPRVGSYPPPGLGR